MPTSIHVNGLYSGAVAVADSVVIESPASTRYILRTITMVNRSASDRMVNLMIRRLGSTRWISPKNMELKSGYKTREDESHVLEPGEQLRAYANGTGVDIVVEGATEKIT
jgi:hypothetical protein